MYLFASIYSLFPVLLIRIYIFLKKFRQLV